LEIAAVTHTVITHEAVGFLVIGAIAGIAGIHMGLIAAVPTRIAVKLDHPIIIVLIGQGAADDRPEGEAENARGAIVEIAAAAAIEAVVVVVVPPAAAEVVAIAVIWVAVAIGYDHAVLLRTPLHLRLRRNDAAQPEQGRQGCGNHAGFNIHHDGLL